MLTRFRQAAVGRSWTPTVGQFSMPIDTQVACNLFKFKKMFDVDVFQSSPDSQVGCNRCRRSDGRAGRARGRAPVEAS